MRTSHPLAKLPLLLTVMLLLGTVSEATPAGADSDDFKLLGRLVTFDGADYGDEGPSGGDETVFTYDLYRRGQAVAAGDGDGGCFREESGARLCVGQFFLDGGEIDIEGPADSDVFGDRAATLDIVDGTGDFENVSGRAHIKPLDKGDGSGPDHRSFKVTFDFHERSFDNGGFEDGQFDDPE